MKRILKRCGLIALKAWFGAARRGKARHGGARQGLARRGFYFDFLLVLLL